MRAGNHLAFVCLSFGVAFTAFVSGLTLNNELQIYFSLV